MKDRFRFLPIFFSIGLHGLMVNFLIPSFQEVPAKEPVTIAVEWEKPPLQESSQEIQPIQTLRHSRKAGNIGKNTPHPPQAATSPTRGEVSVPITHRASYDKDKQEDLDEESPLPLWESSPEGRVRGTSLNSFTSTASERGDASKPSPGAAADVYRAPLKKSHQPLPQYPWICRKRGQEGRVSLLIQTDGEGRVIKVTLHKSSGYSSLDQAALTAAKEWIISDFSRKSVISISFRLNR